MEKIEFLKEENKSKRTLSFSLPGINSNTTTTTTTTNDNNNDNNI